MLYGWIDFNNDGVFDNATERAQATVGDGITDGRFTLDFGVIPEGSTGTTYARFRLSTDAAAANPTGAATDGEVEDYVFNITSPSDGTPLSTVEINSTTANGLDLNDFDNFGRSVASLGDLDGDGINDIAVGAEGDDGGGNSQGAVHVLFLNADGSVKSTMEINSANTNGLDLDDGDNFGSSVASLGDLDGDGIIDIAVGADADDEGGSNRGAVHVLFLNDDGTVKSTAEINSNTTSGPDLDNHDRFGTSVTSLGDLDGDGINDLAVGASRDETVHVLFLNGDGSVKSTVEIKRTNANNFGSAVASLGDLDGDGIADLAVGAEFDSGGDGAVHILFLNTDGTVRESRVVTTETNGGPALDSDDFFGTSVTAMGDLDGDGIADLAVGATEDNTHGKVFILFLRADGTVRELTKIDSDTEGGPTLDEDDVFGISVTSLGDLDGDGIVDLAVGAYDDDEGGEDRGAVHVLFLNSAEGTDFGDAPESFGTTTASHAGGGPRLGTERDSEEQANLSDDATGDDLTETDDEDGVTFNATLLASPFIRIIGTVEINLQNADSTSNRLDAFLDFNGDGVFDDPNDRLFTNFDLETDNGV